MKFGDEEVLTLVQAAARAGLSPNTLRAQIRNDVLPAKKAGKTYLVTASDVDCYVREHKGRRGPKPKHQEKRGS